MAKMAFIFSGQGAQKVGMARDVCEAYGAARKVFDIADQALGRSISGLCFNGAQDSLDLTHNTQPCLLAAELSVYAVLAEKGIKPDAVAGFSLGEYAALTAAGAFKTEDVFQIIQVRADAMQDAVPVGAGAMAAVMKQDADAVRGLCDTTEGYVVPANFNCPGQIVVSGEANAVDKLISAAKEKKIRVIKLPVSVPSHCALMKPAAEVLREALKKITIDTPRIPCYSNVDANLYSMDTNIIEQLCNQVTSPVLWERTLENLYEEGIRVYVEIGPGNTLSSFVKKTLPRDVSSFSVNSVEGILEFEKSVKEITT